MSDNEEHVCSKRKGVPGTEAWMLDGLRIMRHKISRDNRLYYEREQMLIEKNRQSRSRALSLGGSADAAAAADPTPSPDGSDDLFDSDYPASQYRYMERQQRLKDQASGVKAPARVEKRIDSISKDRVRVQASQISDAERRAVFFGSFPRKISATITRPGQQAASSESRPLAMAEPDEVAEVTSSTDVIPYQSSSDEEQENSNDVYPNRPSQRSGDYRPNMNSNKNLDSTPESDVSGSHDE